MSIFLYKKQRDSQELIERLLIINFVDEILKKGVFFSIRKKSAFSYYEIRYKKEDGEFSAIVSQSENQKFILLSCFRVKKKRTLS